MSYHLETDVLVVGCIIFPGIVAIVMFTMIYRHYLSVRWRDAVRLAFAAAVIAGFWIGVTKGEVLLGSRLFGEGGFAGSPEYYLFLVVVGFWTAVMCAAGIAAKVYQAVVLHRASTAERAAGAAGFRAWFGPANLAMGTLVVLGTYAGMGLPMWETGAAIAAVLGIYPAGATLMREEPGDAADAQDAGEERRRVLEMVETGKISGADGAELIGALGQGRMGEPGGRERGGFSRNLAMMLLGAAVLLVGFCLPFEKINVTQAMNGVIAGASINSGTRATFDVNQPRGTWPDGSTVALPYPQAQVPEPVDVVVTARAGEIRYGLGWVMMGLGAAAALLPLIWPAKREHRPIQGGISLAALAAGTIILVYFSVEVLSAGPTVHIQPGLVLMAAGYALLWAGEFREYYRGRIATGRVALAA